LYRRGFFLQKASSELASVSCRNLELLLTQLGIIDSQCKAAKPGLLTQTRCTMSVSKARSRAQALAKTSGKCHSENGKCLGQFQRRNAATVWGSFAPSPPQATLSQSLASRDTAARCGVRWGVRCLARFIFCPPCILSDTSRRVHEPDIPQHQHAVRITISKSSYPGRGSLGILVREEGQAVLG
jgi:hypothetical protein